MAAQSCQLARAASFSHASFSAASVAASVRGRQFRSVTDAGELEEILGAHVAKQPAGAQADGPSASPALRREALALYRDILRASRLFTWTNESGHVWCDERMLYRENHESALFIVSFRKLRAARVRERKGSRTDSYADGSD